MRERDSRDMGPRAYTRRDFLKTGAKAGATLLTTGLFPQHAAPDAERYNVLLILLDDLRPMLACYGHPMMQTPNIDRVAAGGTLFTRAYCQYPLCSPSRTALLTGLRPDTTKVLNNTADFREKVPEAVTLPQHFRTFGYHTQSIGRVMHRPKLQDDENSWSVPSWRAAWSPLDKATTPSWQALDVNDGELRDGRTARQAVLTLEAIQDRPFFLAVGFYKPHFPLEAPRKYFDLYGTDTFALPTAPGPPIDAPTAALNDWDDFRAYQDLPAGTVPLSDAKTLELIRAYAASISYVDAQVGRMLARLENLGLAEKTVVVICSDHGHHLGDQGMWGKQTLFEASLRTPLIVNVPGHRSAETDTFAELVDIYPTLCEACRLPIPHAVEGTSLVPVLEQPSRPWKTAVFSRFGGQENGGRSIRTARYRYTEWGEEAKRGTELYDYETDPAETVNVAARPENTELVEHLRAQLHAGWRDFVPDTHPHPPLQPTLPWDVNDDGQVDILDLLLISESFGEPDPAYPKVDVDRNGQVDIVDFLWAATHFGDSTDPAAPSVSTRIDAPHQAMVRTRLAEARRADDGSALFREGIAALEDLLLFAAPMETTLLPNYPNPFNPETWIPYDLAADAEVTVRITDTRGDVIRLLSLGFQQAGRYRTSARAAYWDGRNALGEPVASGTYFYTLSAGRTKTTRRMVILK